MRPDPVRPDVSGRLLAVPALAGCLVALTLGRCGRPHAPTGVAVDGFETFSARVLPPFGGLVFALLVLIWFTSAFWFFSFFGVRR